MQLPPVWRVSICWAVLYCGTACAENASDNPGGGGNSANVSSSGAGGTSSAESSASAGGAGGSGGSGGASVCEEKPCKLVPPQCGCGAGEQCSVGAPTQTNPSGRFCSP